MCILFNFYEKCKEKIGAIFEQIFKISGGGRVMYLQKVMHVF